MEKLYKGIKRFQESFFKKEEEFFKRLSTSQDPDVLFITCADSRVDPTLVTQSRPGELFILRNVGNIVPPENAVKDKNSVIAAIEFAVKVLKVSDIIICGHSNCGAMKALYKEDSELEGMPHLRDWIRLALPVKEEVGKTYGGSPSEVIQTVTEMENVLAQVENIQTYPFVFEALREKRLFLHGWYYDIGTGKMYAYLPEEGRYSVIK